MAQLMHGKNVVKQILVDKNKNAKRVLLVNQDQEILSLARKANVKVQMIDRKTLDRMTKSDKNQGVAIEIDDYKTASLADVVNNTKGSHGLIIALDGLEDPHNLGAILRTADASGANGVIYPKDRSVGLTPTVAKVSAGAIDTVPAHECVNLVRTLQELKKQGWWIVGTDMKGENYRSLNYDFNVVLVIGNEGKGISRLVREECDYMVTLPMRGKIQSLNASVSAGILMYEIQANHF